MKPKVNLTDIAKEAGVSVATVSRMLSGKGPVRPATREKLETLIRQYSYDPRNLSRGFKKNRRPMVGLVAQQLGHPYFLQACTALERAVRERGCSLLLGVGTNDPGEEERVLQHFLDQDVDALVFLGGSTNFAQPPERFKAVVGAALDQVPVGFLNGYFELEGVVQVRSDEAGGVRELLDRAWDLGHRDFAYLGGDPGAGAEVVRLNTFCGWMADRGLSVGPGRLWEKGFGIRHGAAGADDLMASGRLPTVVLCCNDIVASGAIARFGERGVVVPAQVSVLGFDGMDLEEYPFPPVSSAAQQYAVLAETLVGRLLDPATPGPPVLVPTVPVPGRTLAPPVLL